MNSFFEMGGYGGYVWPAYAISAIGLGLLVAMVLRRHAQLRAKLAAETAKPTDDQRANG